MRSLSRLGSRSYGVLIAPRAAADEDRRRELALNGLLLVSGLLALVVAVQRAVQIAAGGPVTETADHVQTLKVLMLALAAFTVLLVASRAGHPVRAAWGLLAVLYVVQGWSFVSEGPQKSTTILLCMVFVVAAGVLCGSVACIAAAGAVTATLVAVAGLESVHVLKAPGETFASVPDAVGVFEIVGAFTAVALLLSTRTRERTETVAELVGSPAFSTVERLRTNDLSVRELQVVRLLAQGASDANISRDLFVSVRTVHSHVSSALRKTGCANRTELAVLAIREGAVAPEVPAESPSR